MPYFLAHGFSRCFQSVNENETGFLFGSEARGGPAEKEWPGINAPEDVDRLQPALAAHTPTGDWLHAQRRQPCVEGNQIAVVIVTCCFVKRLHITKQKRVSLNALCPVLNVNCDSTLPWWKLTECC